MKKGFNAKLLSLAFLSITLLGSHVYASEKGNNDIRQEVKQQEEKIKVSGTVVDDQGEPLIGVTIRVTTKTGLGTSTDIDGNFVLEVDRGDILEFSYVGFAPQTVVIKDATPLKITLKEDSQLLDEVVVTALGIKRSEKALSYNVQQVKGDDLTEIKDANFMNALSGKVAGVNINASSSGVGGATRVVMRGPKSINSDNNALYVIDGVPIFNVNRGETGSSFSTQPRGEGISDINPDDIESMSVLSGPAAAALYGSNAAQGVILITTKKGKEGKASVTISNSSTFSTPFVMPRFQTSYISRPGEFKSWGEKAASPYGTYDPAGFFRTGSNIQNTVSLSVGNEKNQTYLSIGTTNAKGIIPNSAYNRYNFSARNTTSFLNDKMVLDLGFSYIKQSDKNLIAQGRYFNPLPSLYLFPRGENFELTRMYQIWNPVRQIYTQNWSWGDQGLDMQNPYWLTLTNSHGARKDRYMANASLKYDILDWLDVTGRVRMDNAETFYEDKRAASTIPLFTSGSPYGFYKHESTTDKQVYADILFNINKVINDHSISANIGGSTSYQNMATTGFQGGLRQISNVFNPFEINYGLPSNDNRPIYDGWKHLTNSLFASAEWGYRSMLYLTATARNDWDSSLANTENLSFFYPSVGLSGILSEMFVMPKFVNYLKLRGSFAMVGSAIPRNLSSRYQYTYDPAFQTWKNVSYRPLGKLLPEKTNSWEAGLSGRFFNNDLTIELTWYRSNTFNQTFNVPVSSGSGYNSMYIQTGNVQNTGIELAIGYGMNFGDFDWNTNLTFSTNKNRIVELVDEYEDALSGEVISVDRLEKGAAGSLTFMLTKDGTMGDLYVKNRIKRDSEGNVYINPSTKMIELESLGSNYEKVGSVLPKANLGWRNDFSFKGFRFGFMLGARLGGVVASPTQAFMDLYGVSEETALARDNGGVAVNNGVVDAEQFYAIVGGENGDMLRYIYDATNVRLQELSLGYTLPSKWFNDKAKLSLSLVGRNLWMIYNKAPFDPEVTASTGTYYQGIDYFMQPSLKNIGFNIKLQF